MGLYNHHIPPGTAYRPIEPETPENGQAPDPNAYRTRGAAARHVREASAAPLSGSAEKAIGDLLGGFFQNISLERLDSGDILLALIVLFLFAEGDDLDLVIALGLMLLLGLGEPDQPSG